MNKRSPLKTISKIWSGYSFVFIFAAIFLAYFIVNSSLTWVGVTNILRHSAVIGIIALGMGLVVITGQIDLSVGSMLAFVGGFTVMAFNVTNSIALALDRTEIRDDSYLALFRGDDRLLKYLRGETISVTPEDGLKASGTILVGIGNYPLGFAKINGQTAKNMYPKAWRLI